MADVTPAASLAQVQSVAAGGQQTQSVPLPRLAPGAVISGTVIGKDAGGSFLLRTAQGTVALRSSVPLTYNSDVVVRMESGAGGASNARIISVNGEPFASFSAPATPEGDVVTTSLAEAAQASDASAPPAASSGSVQATVLSVPAGSNVALVNGARVIVQPQQAPAPAPPPAGNGAPTPFPKAAAPAGSATSSADETPANVAKLVTPQPESQTAAASSSSIQPQSVVDEIASSAQAVPQVSAQSQSQGQPQPQANVAAALSQVPDQVETQTNTAVSAAQTFAQAPDSATYPSVQAQAYAAYAKSAASASPASASGSAPQQTQEAGSAPAPASPSPAPASPAPAAAGAGAGASSPPSASSVQPAAPSPAAGAPAAVPLVQAEVSSVSPEGIVTLQTALGPLALQAQPSEPLAGLTPGTTVTVLLPLPSATQAQAPAALTELATSWTTLSDILKVAQATNPAAAASMLANLPELGPDFAASSMTFISAFSQGNARKLVGEDTVSSLSASGRDDLLEKLGGEVSNVNQAYTPPTGDSPPHWQMFLIPFSYQQALQEARLYVKRDMPKKRASSKAAADTRFIVEVDLSDLGPVQMDGLVRKAPQSTAFDLIIRSRTAFSRGQQTAMAGIFENAASITGFKGTLAFQTMHDFPVKPLDEILKHAPRSVTA